MESVQAIKAALSLFHLPARLKAARAEPLPPGVDLLLRAASGDQDALSVACTASERSPDLVRQACVFYVEQVLFSPDSDYYRLLGTSCDASISELRRNMALLLTWLHPDKDVTGERTHLAMRVTAAWDTLRSREQRAAYDASLVRSLARDPGVQRTQSRSMSPQASAMMSKGNVRFSPPSPESSRRRPVHPHQHGLIGRGLLYLRRMLRDRSGT
jgi:hypothetical protein